MAASGAIPDFWCSAEEFTCTSTRSWRPSFCNLLSSSRATWGEARAGNSVANRATYLALLVCSPPTMAHPSPG